MKQIKVKTAYGEGCIANIDDKKKMLGRISDAMSIRNTKFNEFSKELDSLLKKYKL